MEVQLQGIIPPMVTPFKKDGRIDERSFCKEVEHLVETGVHGLAVGGSTGEGHTLSKDELSLLTRRAISLTSGKVPIIAGIITDSTMDVIDRAKEVADTGVSALQITPVHYLFTPTEDEMFDYYYQISEQVKLPIIIYNVVPWSYCSPKLLAKMIAEIEHVIGVKQSAGDIHALAELLTIVGPRAIVLTALDDLLYPSFVIGAHGAIAAILTVVPKASISLWQAVQNGDHNKALKIHKALFKLWSTLSGPNLPAKVKTAMKLQGREAGVSRAPMQMPSRTEAHKIKEALEYLNQII